FKMGWLLRTMCFAHILGTIFGLFVKNAMNPEAHMNISEIISYWGYPWEVYTVVTEDGYILPVYRIPHGKNDFNNLALKPAVLLQHGLALTASIWVVNPPNNSLAFLLADAGYDVWMGNSRGNTLARRHMYLDPDSKEFWAFSVDELIKYDLPATVDFIVNKTGQKQIHYVGHSQGALIAFGAFSTNLQLAQKVKINFAIAPIATVKYIKSAIRIIAYIKPSLFKILFGEKDIASASPASTVVQNVCQRKILGKFCNHLLTLIYGYDPQNLNESRFDVYAGQTPAGTSVQTALHYAQAIHSGVFQAYDWGSPSLNVQHYNQPTPPLYKVEDMKVPTAMWSGGQDLMADPIDVKNLEAKLSNLIYHKKISYFNHLDFVIGLDVRAQVYNEI
uniref:Lipase n=1 Tax=Jaculus jaculus TaxID=51337 RepID=A0A8C5KV41_JACJA